MRIDDMVKSALGSPLPAPPAVRKARAELLAGHASGDATNGDGATLPGAGYNAATFVDPTVGKAAVQDAAEFSPLALASASSGAQPTAAEPTPVDQADQSTLDVVGAIVDQYTRQRAVLAYTMPLGRGVLSLTLEVESAYRVTQLVLPGSTMDVTA